MVILNQVYLTNDLMNWVDWLNDLCMLMVMEGNNFWFDCHSTLCVWYVNAEDSLQLHLATFCSRHSLWTKTTKNDQKWPKNKVFPLFWKMLPFIFTGNGLNENWCCSLCYCTSPITGEILALELQLERFLTD